MEDTQIIDLYWDRDQSAVAATAGKYGGFLHTLSWNILRSHHDAEECVNDTYFRAWNAIPPERPSALRAWLGRITRNLSIDRWKAGRAQSRGAGLELLLGELDECVPDCRGPEQAAEEQVIAESISAFLRKQSADNRYIFLRRYWYGEDIAAIAKGLGCGESRVKSALFQTRKALRVFLEGGGYHSMKAERLFRAIGLVDDDLVEEAAQIPARKRPIWRRYGAMAACLAVLCGTGFAWLVTGGFHGYGAADSSGAGGSGINGTGAPDAISFMSYAGRCCP